MAAIMRGNSYIDSERNGIKDQYLHCLVTSYDMERAGGDYEKAVLNGKASLQEEYDRNVQKFLDSDGDESLIYLSFIAHSIVDGICPEHQWKFYDNDLEILIPHQKEGLRGKFLTKDIIEAIRAVQKEIKKLYDMKSAKNARENNGTEIGDVWNYWWIGTPSYLQVK